jgi:hypothetical protein
LVYNYDKESDNMMLKYIDNKKANESFTLTKVYTKITISDLNKQLVGNSDYYMIEFDPENGFLHLLRTLSDLDGTKDVAFYNISHKSKWLKAPKVFYEKYKKYISEEAAPISILVHQLIRLLYLKN